MGYIGVEQALFAALVESQAIKTRHIKQGQDTNQLIELRITKVLSPDAEFWYAPVASCS